MSGRKNVEELARAVNATPGWSAERRRRTGHWCFRSPSGAVVFTAGTPGGGRGWANLRSQMRKLGWPA